MLTDDPLWYKDAVIYELHVRAFHDSVGDGMGDFRGLAQKLDYLQDLGVTAIWLLPFYPSPQRDDGYDIADYTTIHPDFGTLRDFQELLAAAHDRGIRVITELVINHTSDQHPWFQRARVSPPGSPERDFYVWSDSPDKYPEARIIFKDFEHSNWTYDHVAKAYYWHRFYSHQPDLNYDNPAVWDAIFPVVDFWLGMGVDGMRLDAVPYLYEREGTSCENLPETHVFLKALRKHIDQKFSNRMLLSEANQWPEDAVAYFGNGDETHVAFHFPLMPRMFMSIHMEDRYPIIDILAQTPVIPDNCQWCQFLRNHDELTLEMVTDEERDYMYRAYAIDPRARINLGIRRRLAPLLGNNRRRIELMNGLLCSLPGTPVIYYGDEIGMGDNIYLGDRNGVRTPMQWSSDRNAGFSRANPQKLYLPIIIDPEYHYEAINVEAQNNNPHSLLWWMKRLIALRKRYKAFGRGTLEFLSPANRKILAFVRRHEDETLLVVANLSRFVQHVELDLSMARGSTPVELMGHTQFPPVGTAPYPLTLGPHAFYWFELEPQKESTLAGSPTALGAEPPSVLIPGGAGFSNSRAREELEQALQLYLEQTSWARAADRPIKTVRLRDTVTVSPPAPGQQAPAVYVSLLEVEYADGNSHYFHFPGAVMPAEQYQRIREQQPLPAIARLSGVVEGVLIDAMHAPECAEKLLRVVAGGAITSSRGANLVGTLYGPIDWLTQTEGRPPVVGLNNEGQAHTSVVFGEQLVLKALRPVAPGLHPEVEMGRYLTQKANFPHAAPLIGTLDFQRHGSESVTLAVVHRYIPNEGTAWQFTLDELSRYFERVLALPAEERAALPDFPLEGSLAPAEMPPLLQELIGRYHDLARLMGERTADLHKALAANLTDPAFAPESYNPMYQRAMYQSMRNMHHYVLDFVARKISELPPEREEDFRQLLTRRSEILGRFKSLLDRKISGKRLRGHGSLSLSEMLYTGKDFVFIDFEGEDDRSLTDRRIKRSPLRDVAGMVYSFHFAASSALHGIANRRGRTPGMVRSEDFSIVEPWSRIWHHWVSHAFLRSYHENAFGAGFLSKTVEEFESLFADFLLERAMRELAHELAHRPQASTIPLDAVLPRMSAIE